MKSDFLKTPADDARAGLWAWRESDRPPPGIIALDPRLGDLENNAAYRMLRFQRRRRAGFMAPWFDRWAKIRNAGGVTGWVAALFIIPALAVVFLLLLPTYPILIPALILHDLRGDRRRARMADFTDWFDAKLEDFQVSGLSAVDWAIALWIDDLDNPPGGKMRNPGPPVARVRDATAPAAKERLTMLIIRIDHGSVTSARSARFSDVVKAVRAGLRSPGGSLDPETALRIALAVEHALPAPVLRDRFPPPGIPARIDHLAKLLERWMDSRRV